MPGGFETMSKSVCHITTLDVGGAGIAAHRLHTGLRNLGVVSNMAVARKSRIDDNVYAFGPPMVRFWRRLPEIVATRVKDRQHARHARTLSPSLELFSDDRVDGVDALSSQLPDMDVYNIHWVAGFLDWQRTFARIPSDRPVVFTLHDMNPFTGGCHYSLGCDRFTQACGACPQLGSFDPKDVSSGILQRKVEALAKRRPENTRVVAPSQWLAEAAARSTLFSRFPVDVIPNGVDTDNFRPRDPVFAREVLGLPQGKPIILFVAESFSNHRKGFDLLTAALAELPEGSDITLAAVGSGGELPAGAFALGRIENERLMSLAMSAADVFVMPTRADNLPNVLLEVMACGTPCVSFDVGGVPDLVRPGETGLLAPPEDVVGLRDAILRLVADEAGRNRMSTACRALAEAHSIDVQARRYIKLYDDMSSASASFV